MSGRRRLEAIYIFWLVIFCMAFVQEVSTPVFREQILLFQRYLRTGVLFLLEKDSIQAKRYSYDPNVRHFEMVFD